MSPKWETLPLLPLRCILDHLCLEDAIAAMSVCRHWRSAVLLYEGHKETLTLRAKHLDQCLYLTRLFRKYTNKLHIYLDCNKEELDKFTSYVLPQFFDTVKLYEILFIGPSYSEQNPLLPVVKLKRVITETLIYKHSNNLRKLAMLGCDMGIVKNENDRFIHKNVEYYSRALSFQEGGDADAVFSRANISLMEFSTLQHLIVDYEQINTEALETLSQLGAFSRLTMNVNYNSQVAYSPIDWDRLDACYPNALDVSVNLIGVPMDKMDEVIFIVLREGMLLTSLKVLYCKTLYQPVLEHIVRLYKETLRELVWVDCPEDDADNRFVHPDEDASQYGLCNVNPFILLCWQCSQLRRLVIHGYWVWQYDLLGFVRLCRSLGSVVVPALYRRQSRFRSSDRAVRVLATDQPQNADEQFVQEMNEYTEFQWKPTPWSKLHPGLQARALPHQRSAYLLQEALQPLGVT